MANGFQSIEDLLPGDDKQTSTPSDDGATSKLQDKEKEISIKQVEELTEEKAKSVGISYISLSGFPISPEALSQINEEQSKRLQVVCFLYTGRELRLGAVDVNDEVKALLKTLSDTLHAQGSLYLISPGSFKKAFTLYKTLPKPKKIVKGVEVTEADLDKYSEQFSSFKDLQTEVDKADVSKIITMMLAASVKSRASDIHIESEEKDVKLRFRIDGVLIDVAIVNQQKKDSIISRLKVLAKVKINVDNRPQDGRFAIFMGSKDSDKEKKKRKIDIRISFLPTAHGESVVMRLLDSSKQNISFDSLGLTDKAFEQLKKEVERPNGMIITTGPTGSGKTTTLYAILKKLNSPESKIITIEDPIEYQIEGINQSQVGEKYTFAKGLRSIVRQDPDILMVGEIRDLETAEIAIQASLTGHLVLSTLHTNDASGTIPRLLSMGVKSFLLSPSMNAMIGQRLVRRVCEACKKKVELTPEQTKRLDDIIKPMNEDDKKNIKLESATFYKGGGCDECQGLGYKGRLGIYEVMIMSKDIEALIQAEKISEYDISQVAQKNGMITMAQDGIMKAMQGLTTIDEVLRVAE